MQAFVFYESFLKTAELLDPKDRLEFYDALTNYGIYGEIYNGDNKLVQALLVQAITNIDCAKDRYKAAVENGKKGGRPRKVDWEEMYQLMREGWTDKDIADHFNCSQDYIRKKRKEKEEFKQKNQKNLNENDNVKLNVNDNDKVSLPTANVSGLRPRSSTLYSIGNEYDF